MSWVNEQEIIEDSTERFEWYLEYYENILEIVKDVETYFMKFKGPKVNLFIGRSANKLIELFEPKFRRLKGFNIDPIFEDSYLSTKRNSNQSKATALKIALITINLTGCKINERQLLNTLKGYKKVDPKFKTESFNCVCEGYIDSMRKIYPSKKSNY